MTVFAFEQRKGSVVATVGAQNAEEISGAYWFPLAGLPSLSYELDRDLYLGWATQIRTTSTST